MRNKYYKKHKDLLKVAVKNGIERWNKKIAYWNKKLNEAKNENSQRHTKDGRCQ